MMIVKVKYFNTPDAIRYEVTDEEYERIKSDSQSSLNEDRDYNMAPSKNTPSTFQISWKNVERVSKLADEPELVVGPPSAFMTEEF